MWIVNIALRRPYTFVVMALLILLSMPHVLQKMSVDTFPSIDIPVVVAICSTTTAGCWPWRCGSRITCSRAVDDPVGGLTSSTPSPSGWRAARW